MTRNNRTQEVAAEPGAAAGKVTRGPSSGDSDTPAWLPWAAVAVTLLLWASAFVAIRHLGHDFSPGSLSLGRLAVGSIALGVVAIPRGLRRLTRRQTISILLVGILWFGIYNLALNAGEQHVDAGTAAMLIQVSPVLIAVLAAVFLAEPFTVTLGAGLAIAFGGIVLISAGSSSSGKGDVIGVVLCVVAAAVYAISAILQKPLVADLPAVYITWLACTVGAITCLPWAGQLAHDVTTAPLSSTLWVVYLGVLPTAIAFTTYAFALRHMSVSSLGVTTYLVPPITIVLGALFLGEAPPLIAYLGGVLALGGVALARKKSKKNTTDVEDVVAVPSQV